MALLPQLKLSAPNRSNFDLSYINRFTATPGALYPVMVQRCLPGDHFEIKLKHLVKTFALKAPLMGKMLLKFDLFFVPDRLYVSEFRQNNVALNTFADSADVLLPYFNLPLNGTMNGNTVNSPVAASSLLDFLGIPPGFRDLHSPEGPDTANAQRSGTSTKFNALSSIGYLDIWRNYYRNPQEIYGFQYGSLGTTGENGIAYVDCSRLDEFFQALSTGDFKNITFNPADNNSVGQTEYNSYSFLRNMFDSASIVNPLSGLMLRCYQPDYLTNFISTQAYDRIQSTGGGVVIVKEETSRDSFTVNQFRLANKLQKLAERAIIAGNRYGEYIRAMFGVRTDDKLDIPEYLGSYSSVLSFQDIVNTARPDSQAADSTDSFNALGASGGRGINADQSGKFYINTTEYGNLICMFSIVPMPDYFQGIQKSFTKIYLSDEFNPQLDRLGWQGIRESEYHALPTYTGSAESSATVDWDNDSGFDPFKRVVGYQPAWLEYMTRVNELHGEFTDTLNYWTIGRTFDRTTESDMRPTPDDILPSAYIFPTDFNVSFVDSAPNAQNFMVQVAFDIFAKRPISKKLMPNLG